MTCYNDRRLFLPFRSPASARRRRYRARRPLPPRRRAEAGERRPRRASISRRDRREVETDRFFPGAESRSIFFPPARPPRGRLEAGPVRPVQAIFVVSVPAISCVSTKAQRPALVILSHDPGPDAVPCRRHRGLGEEGVHQPSARRRCLSAKAREVGVNQSVDAQMKVSFVCHRQSQETAHTLLETVHAQGSLYTPSVSTRIGLNLIRLSRKLPGAATHTPGLRGQDCWDRTRIAIFRDPTERSRVSGRKPRLSLSAEIAAHAAAAAPLTGRAPAPLGAPRRAIRPLRLRVARSQNRFGGRNRCGEFLETPMADRWQLRQRRGIGLG